MIGLDWTYHVNSETSEHPGPEYVSYPHNYKIRVWRDRDGNWQYMITINAGKFADTLVYRTDWDAHYEKCQDPHITLERAQVRMGIAIS